MAETFSVVPDLASKRSKAPRMKRIAFGNGYTQKWGDGINSNLETWDLTFTANSDAELTVLEDFFNANYLTFFHWTSPLPGAAQKAYECVAWDISFLGANNYTVTCTFSEWPGLSLGVVTPSTIMTGDLEMLPDLELV